MLPDFIMQSVWLQYYFFVLLVAYPVYRVFSRAGLPVWWMGAVVLPFIGLTVCAGLLAFHPWPAAREGLNLKRKGDNHV